MNPQHIIPARFGIHQVIRLVLAAVLLAQSAVAATTNTWSYATLSSLTCSTTAASTNVVLSGGTYVVGQLITLPAAGGIAASTYYIVYASGTTIAVSATPGGTAVSATATTSGNALANPYSYYDWTDTTRWSSGGAPNSSSVMALFPDTAVAGAGNISVSGNQTLYGFTFTGSGSQSVDLSPNGGGNGTSVGGFTFATSDATTPVITMNSAGNVRLVNFGGTKQINFAGSQGLILRSALGTVTGSGFAATATAPTKNLRLSNVSWTGFSGGIIIDRGDVQIQNNDQLSTSQDLTVGGAFSSANSVIACLSLNGSKNQTVGNLNGNSWGRIRSGGTLTIGNGNATGGNYGGLMGIHIDGTINAINLVKTGTGTQTLSGLIKGTGTVTVNGGGTLILSGANTYSGTTTVTAGKLVVSSAQLTTNNITVANGATLGVTASGTSPLQPATLTLGSTAATTLEFNNLASTTAAPLKPVTNVLNGTVTVNINSGTLSPAASYPLVTWTATTGTGSFVLGTSPLTGNLSISGNTLYFNVSLATNTWTGGNNGNWDTATTGNWTAGGAAGIYSDGSLAVFDDTAPGATNVTVNQLVKPGIAAFNNSALAYSVTSSSGSYIGGTAALSKSGTGALTLAGPNTYSGGTSLSGGQLNLNYGGSSSANSAIGTGPLTLGGGTLDNTSSGDVALVPVVAQNWNSDFAYIGSVHNLNLGGGAVVLGANRQVAVSNNTLTVGGVISDTGLGYSLTKTGNGTLALGGLNTFSGGMIVSNGTVQAGSTSALGTGPSQLYGITLDLNGNSLVNSNNINSSAFMLTNSSATAGALVGNSAVNSDFTIGVGTGGISVGRLIKNGGSYQTVTKVGSGTLTFNGAGYNNLMAITVNAGTAVFANTGGSASDRGVTLNGGTLKLAAAGYNSTAPNANQIGDNVPFTLNGGTFDLNGWNETVAVVNGTNGVILNNAAGTTSMLSLGGDNGSGTFAGTLQNGAGVLALTKLGTGTQTLSNPNTYTGGTIITNGVLQAGTNHVFPTAGGDVTVYSGGTLDLNTFDNAINGLNGPGTVSTAGGAPTLTVGCNGDSGNFSGTILSALSLTKMGTGTQALTGGNSYGGTTTISNGTLVISSGLTGGGVVMVHGPGVLNATNASPYVSGAVTLADSGATLSLQDGAIGTLLLNGGLTVNNGSILKFDISSSGVDVISIVGGTFTQSGMATVSVSQISAPNVGTYMLISGAAGVSANNFTLGNSLSGYALSLTSDGANLYLVVALNAPASAYWHNRTGTAWTGHTGSAYNWDTDQYSDLNAGTVPAASSDVYFAANDATSLATTLGADFILKSLTFNVANNVTIAGPGTLTLNGALTVNYGAGSNTISAGSVVLGVDQNINVSDAANTLTISSPLSGAHALNVNAAYGSGTVALSGSSTYTGGTTISYGTLALNNPTNTLPDTGAVNISGGTLSLGTNNDTVGTVTLASGAITGLSGVLTASSYNVQNGTISAHLGGSGALNMNGSSVLLASNSTYSGGTTISSGTLQLGASNALGSGSVTLGANTLDLNGQTIPNVINCTGAGTLANNGASSATVTADANVTSSFTIDATGGNITVARLIGTGAARTLTKTGANTLTFNGAGHNNLIKLVVQGGTVVCGNNGGYSADRGLELDYGTILLAGPGSGGAVPNANLFNDTQQFYLLGGTFDLNGWNETVATVYGTGGAVIENNAAGTNSTLTLGADSATNTWSLPPSLNVYSGTLQDANGVLSLTKIGLGTQVLNGASTYSGNTTINAGQLELTASAASPNSTYVVNTNGGLLFQTDTAFVLGGLSGTGNVALLNDSSSVIRLAVGGNNASMTYSGALSDGGAGATLTKVGTGTLTLSGTNTYTGLTTVSNGVLVISPNDVAGGNFTVNEGAVLGVSSNTPATSAQIGTLTLGLSGLGHSAILFTGLPCPANAPLTVSTLSPVGGAGSVLITNTAALGVGTYSLINYTSLTGAGFSAFALAPLPPSVVAHLTNNTAATPSQIQLVVTAILPQIWSGAVNTNWDINTTANWKLNGMATNYFDFGPVLFDDSVGAGQSAVNLVTNVQPVSVTVSNNTKNYTWTTSSGSGITSPSALTKDGSGTLTLVNLTNNFGGGAIIKAGTVVLSSSTLGGGGIADNGSLVFSGGATTVSNVISGTGTLTQNSTNTLDIISANIYSGGTVIASGTIQSDNPNALGTGAVTLGDGVSGRNATLQASSSSISFSNTNPIVIAAGGSGIYKIADANTKDYHLSGSLALNNALTLSSTSDGALWLDGAITSSGANPVLTVDGGGTTTKFVSFTADNSTTFTGNILITNKGDFKAGNNNALSSANPVALDSTSTFDNGSRNLTIAGLNQYAGAGGTVADAGSGIFLTLGGSGSYSFSGVINNIGGIVKTGSGQQTFSGANTYSGPTVVSNGTLVVNGSLAGGAVTVAGGTLAGTGTLNGAATVQSGGTLSPGVGGIGTLAISNTLTVQSGGILAMDISRTAGTNDQITGLTALTYGGTLAVNNLDGSLTPGDSFKLFSAGTYTGAFDRITPAAPGAGLVWNTNTLATDGTLRIATGVATNPTDITATVSGNQLQLSWPADHTGWRLLVQTNHLAAGVSSNTNDWMTVPGSDGINQTNLTMDPTRPAEFYRLVYP